ncbi:MAG: SAM-dependent methyltransferase, partial [Planctomycetota bacterium]
IAESNGCAIRLRLRSVNHRFLDLQVRLPEGFEALEPAIRQRVRERLRRGQNLVLVTESGTPGISDPGARLVEAALQEGVRVVPIPGPSALAAAASVAGFPADAFHFAGFLPRKPSRRRKALAALAGLEVPIFLFESPHRVVETLRDILEVLGDRRLTVCRELTKLHEEVWRTTVSGALERYRREARRGEFTLALEGVPRRADSPEELEPEHPG